MHILKLTQIGDVSLNLPFGDIVSVELARGVYLDPRISIII